MNANAASVVSYWHALWLTRLKLVLTVSGCFPRHQMAVGAIFDRAMLLLYCLPKVRQHHVKSLIYWQRKTTSLALLSRDANSVGGMRYTNFMCHHDNLFIVATSQYMQYLVLCVWVLLLSCHLASIECIVVWCGSNQLSRVQKYVFRLSSKQYHRA